MRYLTALLIAGAVGAVSAQRLPRDTFRSGLEVLTVETSVRDASGKPITDLQSSDFTVRIDGKPRQVLTSRLYGHEAAAVAPAAATAAGPAVNVDKPAGRAVMIAVDRDSIRPGGEMAVIDTAARLLDTLSPSDAAGAIGITGTVTDFTRDHAAVAAAVRRMTGTQPITDTRHFLKWDEAIAYERGYKIVISAAIQRECHQDGQYCPTELQEQARDMRVQGRAHADAIMRTLSGVIAQFGTISAPKHLILISAGIPFDEQLLVRYQDVAEKAARAHVALFVVQVDQSDFDASMQGPNAQIFGGREHANGLANIASMTGGQFFGAVGKAGGVFDRIAADINYFYQLGVESLPSDADGKPHKVEVKVARNGVTVIAPGATAAPPRASRTAVQALKAALAEPTDVAELPLEVATYMTHSANPDKVRVIIAAGTGAPGQKPPSLWGSIVRDGDKVAGAVGAEVDANAPAPWTSTGIVELAPGRYRLRTAIVDGDRTGTLELPLVAGLRAVGEARASDLIIGTVAGGRLEPKFRLSAGEKAVAMLELSASQPLKDLAGLVILTPSSGGDPVARAPLAFRARSDDKGVVLGEASLDLAAVSLGSYTASAIIEVAGQAIGRVSRRVDVTK